MLCLLPSSFGGRRGPCFCRSCAAAWLEASLPACLLYEHRGYRTVRHDRWPLENGVVLVYEIMEKTLRGENKGAQI